MILSAMIAGLDDKEDFNNYIKLESLKGFNKLIELIKEDDIRPIFLNILIKLRTYFESVIFNHFFYILKF